MKQQLNKGNIVVSMALAGGMVVFMAAFIQAGIRAINTPYKEQGSVQGVFIAQRLTSGPSPTSTSVRVTLTPLPSPYMKVNVVNTKGTVATFSGRICAASLGGQITSGAVTTSNCNYTPASSFTLPFDTSYKYGSQTGVFVIPSNGWTLSSITSPNTGLTTSSSTYRDERSDVGKVSSWNVNSIPTTGYYSVNVNVVPPPSYDYYYVGKTMYRAPYYPGQAASTPCGTVTTITTCATTYSNTGRILGQCTNNGAVVNLYGSVACASPSVTPAYPPPSTTPSVTTGPACAKNCALQPKGDATCNLVVDSEDYSLWKTSYDKNVGVGTSPKEGPDFNNDGKVNLVDLQTWQDGLFNPPPAPAGACTGPTSDIKPTTAVPTLGPGCYYKQVQCVQAPCPPQVVCPNVTVTGAL